MILLFSTVLFTIIMVIFSAYVLGLFVAYFIVGSENAKNKKAIYTYEAFAETSSLSVKYRILKKGEVYTDHNLEYIIYGTIELCKEAVDLLNKHSR